MCLAERSFNFFSPTVVFFLTWESVERRITSLKSFFRKKRKGELVDNETMHRKVRVNVATFGRFADSVNHQQHRRSWAHAVLTDARFLSFSSFFYSFSYYSLSLFIPYYILRTPLWYESVISHAYANFSFKCDRYNTQNHNSEYIFTSFLSSN